MSAAGGPLTGTAALLRVALRADRVRLPVWAASVGGLLAAIAASLPRAYPDAVARQARAAIMREPSGALLTGPGYGVDEYTTGPELANEMLGLVAVAVALMSVFLVVRHTRAEEEQGRADLVRAGAVGRHAPLTAALLAALVADALVVAVVWVALLAVSGDGDAALPAVDALAFALGVGAVGLTFAGVAAVTAQVMGTARGASGTAGAVLGLAFVLRGVGDAQHPGGSALSWLSPIGWTQQIRTFVDLRWWPLALHVLLAAVLVAAAFALSVRRDVGAGLVAGRRGRATAGAVLRGPGRLAPAGLAARLGRTALVSWAGGLLVFAALTGSLVDGVVDSVSARPELADVLRSGGDVVDGALGAFVGFFAMAVTVHAVVEVNAMRGEERSGRTAAVLATPVSRTRWLLAHVGVVVASSAVLLLVCGAGLALGAASALDDPSRAGALVLAPLAQLPVVAAFAALAAVLVGAGAPAWWGWLVLVPSMLVGLYGPLLGVSRQVVDATPFQVLPSVPAEDVAALPLVLATAVAVALGWAAVVLHRRRDLVA